MTLALVFSSAGRTLSLTDNTLSLVWSRTRYQLSHPGSYCPISLLPLPGKILEKVVHNRLMAYLERNNILEKNQGGGFRKQHSTIDIIANFTQEAFSAMNNREISLVNFIDLKKVFDTVNHQILINKLELLGIKNKSLIWFNSYLKGNIHPGRIAYIFKFGLT